MLLSELFREYPAIFNLFVTCDRAIFNVIVNFTRSLTTAVVAIGITGIFVTCNTCYVKLYLTVTNRSSILEPFKSLKYTLSVCEKLEKNPYLSNLLEDAPRFTETRHHKKHWAQSLQLSL